MRIIDKLIIRDFYI